LAINDKELVIATNVGLYSFNIETRETQVIIQGVEFNRRALYLKNKVLYAGTINGLYEINVDQIDVIIQKNKLANRKSVFDQQWLILITLLFVIIVVLLLFLVLTRRKLKEIQMYEVEETPSKVLTADEVIAYIKENLTTVSIKTINKHFNTNTVQLYNILKPQKPGNIITDLRTEIVLLLRKEGKSAKEIAESTGFSESYIYRVKQK
jgi:AraC-like DNA-binding protein